MFFPSGRTKRSAIPRASEPLPPENCRPRADKLGILRAYIHGSRSSTVEAGEAAVPVSVCGTTGTTATALVAAAALQPS